MSRPDRPAPLRRLRSALPTPRDLAAALPRPNRTWAVRLWWFLVLAWIIYTGPVAYADDPINVTGPGGLFFIPDLAGDGGRLFHERYIGFSYYNIYSEANWNDPLLAALNAVTNFLMYVIVFLGACIASVTGWMFSMTSIDGMATAVGNVMGASAEGTLGWLFPSMLVLGGIVAYASRNSGGEGMFGNLLWLILAGTTLILGTTHSPLLVNSVEGVRTLGSDMVATMSEGATVSGETPIVYANPEDDELEGSASDIAARKNIDAMWRTLVVTPWCLAELGSIEACEAYGTGIITTGGDDREDAIDEVKRAQADSSTSTWLEGMDTGYAVARIVVLLIGLVVAAVFAIFVLVAGLTATFALVMTYLLLIVGPLFVAMGCVPGAPRRWVMNWGRQVIVQLIMSIIAFTIFAAVLSLIAVLFAATASMGWLLSALLTLTALVAGVALRGRLEAIFGVGGEGGSGIGKYLLARKALSMMSGGMRRPSRRPRAPREGRQRDEAPPESPSGSGTGGAGGGGASPGLPSGRGAPPALPPARQQRSLTAGPTARETAPRRDERSAPRAQQLRATTQPTAQRTNAPETATAGAATERALPAGPSASRAHLTSSSPRSEAAPAAASSSTPTGSPRPAPKTVKTTPSPQASPRSGQRVLSGEVIPPEPSTTPPLERPAPGRPHRAAARVRFTRPDLPDAPRTRRASRHMNTSRSPEAGTQTRPVPGPRTHRSSTSGRPRFRAPSYQ
ncbi:type IV secretion system protein [uncultured Brachybacterium sp.]|uniref:type IV secretion system protein n=1 Tax=uncultured Brachybacterium sp. TaxID=189680 RepID=UPI0026200BB5|nr:type IV secretion system protein [uncultured Brachybacterium sp.]